MTRPKTLGNRIKKSISRFSSVAVFGLYWLVLCIKLESKDTPIIWIHPYKVAYHLVTYTIYLMTAYGLHKICSTLKDPSHWSADED